MRTIRISVPDDLDGSQRAEPVRFGLDGEDLEIDLSARNHARLTQAASLHIGHGRTVTPAVRRPPATAQARATISKTWPVTSARPGSPPRPHTTGRHHPFPGHAPG